MSINNLETVFVLTDDPCQRSTGIPVISITMAASGPIPRFVSFSSLLSSSLQVHSLATLFSGINSRLQSEEAERGREALILRSEMGAQNDRAITEVLVTWKKGTK